MLDSLCLEFHNWLFARQIVPGFAAQPEAHAPHHGRHPGPLSLRTPSLG